MTDCYNTEYIEHDGQQYKINYYYDQDHEAPWDWCDGHGPVSEWTTRDKYPGELVLCVDAGFNRTYKRYYDFQTAMQIARRDGWNTAPYNWTSKGEQAQAAVMSDFRYLKRWCDSDWYYIGIEAVPQAVDEDGDYIDEGEPVALWGIESESTDYHKEVIQELITELQLMKAAATYPVATMGV